MSSRFVHAALLQGCRQWALVPAGEADQAFGVLLEFLGADCAFSFFGAQLHFGDKAAEVLIAGAGGDQEWKAEGFVFPIVIPFFSSVVIPSGARNPCLMHGLWG